MVYPFTVAIASTLIVQQSHAGALSLDFSSNEGGAIEFGGTNNTFAFNSGTNGFQWTITTETGGSSAYGLQGSVNNGPFSYGAITVNGDGSETANVLGPLGGLVIDDGTLDLTGQVNWIEVTTFYSAGALNAKVMENVTDISYLGSNPDLQLMTAQQPASMDLTFQFSPSMDLIALSTGPGGYTTSYSGSISTVPEPTTLALSGLGGLGLLCLRRLKN